MTGDDPTHTEETETMKLVDLVRFAWTDIKKTGCVGEEGEGVHQETENH